MCYFTLAKVYSLSFLLIKFISVILGTMLSGFSIFCCGKPRVQTKGDQKMETFCINVMVGVMQLFTVAFMLVGWFWGFVWGIYMIILAGKFTNDLN